MIAEQEPFSTELVLGRNDSDWYAALDQPYYIFPCHVSLSFLYSTTLASALCALPPAAPKPQRARR